MKILSHKKLSHNLIYNIKLLILIINDIVLILILNLRQRILKKKNILKVPILNTIVFRIL